MADLDPVQRLTMKLLAVSDGEPPAVCLSTVVSLFAYLTADFDDETFNQARKFFDEQSPNVRAEILRLRVAQETPQ